MTALLDCGVRKEKQTTKSLLAKSSSGRKVRERQKMLQFTACWSRHLPEIKYCFKSCSAGFRPQVIHFSQRHLSEWWSCWPPGSQSPFLHVTCCSSLWCNDAIRGARLSSAAFWGMLQLSAPVLCQRSQRRYFSSAGHGGRVTQWAERDNCYSVFSPREWLNKDL